MREIEGIETVVEKLEPHWDKIEEHFHQENKKFKDLLAIDHDIIGRILKCHMILENYIEQYLVQTYEIEGIHNVRLSFYQKAILLPTSKSSAAFVKPGILRLNSIRNKFAHTLDFELDDNELGIINEILVITRQGVSFEDVISKIEAFTTIACTWLILTPPDLDDVFNEAFKEIRIKEL